MSTARNRRAEPIRECVLDPTVSGRMWMKTAAAGSSE